MPARRRRAVKFADRSYPVILVPSTFVQGAKGGQLVLSPPVDPGAAKSLAADARDARVAELESSNDALAAEVEQLREQLKQQASLIAAQSEREPAPVPAVADSPATPEAQVAEPKLMASTMSEEKRQVDEALRLSTTDTVLGDTQEQPDAGASAPGKASADAAGGDERRLCTPVVEGLVHAQAVP